MKQFKKIHFPIQNLLKILPKISSVVISPVISPSESMELLRSIARISGDSLLLRSSINKFKYLIEFSIEFFCLKFVKTTSEASKFSFVSIIELNILFFKSSNPSPVFAETSKIRSLCTIFDILSVSNFLLRSDLFNRTMYFFPFILFKTSISSSSIFLL